MVVGQLVVDSSNRKIVKLDMNDKDKEMMSSSISKDLNSLASKDATQIMNLLASLCQIGTLLRNAVDSDAELDAFAQNADKIMQNINMVQCLDTDKDPQGGFRSRQVSGIKGIRTLLTTLKRLGLVEAFELCSVVSNKPEPVKVPLEKEQKPLTGGAYNDKTNKKPSRTKGSKKSKGSKGSKGSKKQTQPKPKRAAKKQ